ncbi:MAG: hypothetical protein WC637_12245, partial [Victivallales bacterium]
MFAGSVKEAAQLAGIKYGYARQLMLKKDIVQAIANRKAEPERPPDAPEVKAAILERTAIEKNLSALI